MTVMENYDTVWEIEHADPNERLKQKHKPILANAPLIIKHGATSHYLASDLVDYKYFYDLTKKK